MRKAAVLVLMVIVASCTTAVDTPKVTSSTLGTIGIGSLPSGPGGDFTRAPAGPPAEEADLPELTREIAASSLEDVAAALFHAWLTRNEFLYPLVDRTIREKTGEVVAQHVSPGDETAWEVEYLILARGGLDEFANVVTGHSRFFPERTMTRFAVIGVPAAPVTMSSGHYLVDDVWTGSSIKDQATIPGTYVTLEVEDCYWERRSQNGDIIDFGVLATASRVEVEIRESDHRFYSTCGYWVRVGD